MTAVEPEWGTTDIGALGLLRIYCGWHIAPVRTEWVTVTSRGGHLLTLPTLQLLSIVELKVDGEVIDVAELDSHQRPRLQYSRSGSVRWDKCWSTRLDGIQARIQHGYQYAPSELLAVGRRLQYLLRDGVGGVRVGNISVTPSAVSAASDGLEPLMKLILDQYRLPPLT